MLLLPATKDGNTALLTADTVLDKCVLGLCVLSFSSQSGPFIKAPKSANALCPV